MGEIYYVSAIYADKLTEEDLKKKYEIHKLKYNKDITYEKFLDFLKDFKEDEYNIGSFISSYHLTKEEAIEYATKNIGDINEAGCYQYAGVSKAPTGLSYYNSGQNPKEDFIIYKYNREKDEYEELDKKEKEYDLILHHLWGFV